LVADGARSAGQAMADRAAWRICSANGWWSAFGKPKPYAKVKKAGALTHEDLVGRDFTADAPNRLWLTDIERHEALSNRVGVGDLHRRAVAAAW
jgi:putative transposase